MAALVVAGSDVSPSDSGTSSGREDDRLTKVFSLDLAPTETVEALEGDLLREACEDFLDSCLTDSVSLEAFLVVGLTDSTSLDAFLDIVFAGSASFDVFLGVTASTSLDAFLGEFLLVIFTDEVVFISFCPFDSFLVFPAVLVMLVVEDVLKRRGSLPLAFLFTARSTDFFFVVFFSSFSSFSGSFGAGSKSWPAGA